MCHYNGCEKCGEENKEIRDICVRNNDFSDPDATEWIVQCPTKREGKANRCGFVNPRSFQSYMAGHRIGHRLCGGCQAKKHRANLDVALEKYHEKSRAKRAKADGGAGVGTRESSRQHLESSRPGPTGPQPSRPRPAGQNPCDLDFILTGGPKQQSAPPSGRASGTTRKRYPSTPSTQEEDSDREETRQERGQRYLREQGHKERKGDKSHKKRK